MNKHQALVKLENELIKLNSTSIGRRTFLSSMSLLLAACATTDYHRNREGDNSGQDTTMTVDDEKRMTSEVLPQMKKDYPTLQNTEVQNYISQLGRKLVAANNLENNPYNYNFTAVNVNYVNAFALPAGTVFITAPLIAMADSEAELAGVVGHEIGHIKARHTAERMDAAKKAEGKSTLFAGGGALLGGILGYGASRILCKNDDKECVQKAVGYGLAAGAAGGYLIQKYGFMANSREDEMEADRIGFRTSVNAKYDKDHAGLFYTKLLKMEEQAKTQGGQNVPGLGALADAMSTHPPSKERVHQMQQMASEVKNSTNSILSTKEFDKVKKICQQIVEQNKNKQS